MSAEVVEFPHSVEQEIERMIELERGICPLCFGRCTMRVDNTIYLYCRGCGFQAYIRKEQGARNYGSFLKVVISKEESEGGEDDESDEENSG